jgi:tetratricopeptide (TPR) repeat protein
MRQLAIPCRLALLLALILIPAPSLAAASASEVGEVAFANSGAAAAQEPFLRGLALLHNFEYDDAVEQFRKAEAIDPNFAMAYWGEAMTFTHPVWFQQDLAAARAALAHLAPTSEARLAKAPTARERDYLHAVNVLYGNGTKEERDVLFSDAMALIHQRYPDDVDATAFYALSLLGTAHHGRDFSIYMRSAALLEEVFPTHQHHPGVLHYLIHSYDDPIHAPLGMRAARLYGAVAPNAGHALHMTSHIFVALGLWDDVIAANVQAMRVVNEHRAAQHKRAKTCGHYVSWLNYAYLQEHRLDDARQQLDACRQMAMDQFSDHPDPDPSLVPAYAEMRVFHLVETGRWDADDALAIPEGRNADARFLFAYGDALAAAKQDRPALHAASIRLHERQKELLAQIAQKKDVALDRSYVDLAVQQIDALETIESDNTTEGIARLRKVADAETALPLEFGPPPLQKPASELLGDQLLAAGRNAEAAQAYQSALDRAPGRTLSLQGLLRAQTALGQTDAAARTQAQLQRYVKGAPAASR